MLLAFRVRGFQDNFALGSGYSSFFGVPKNLGPSLFEDGWQGTNLKSRPDLSRVRGAGSLPAEPSDLGQDMFRVWFAASSRFSACISAELSATVVDEWIHFCQHDTQPVGWELTRPP